MYKFSFLASTTIAMLLGCITLADNPKPLPPQPMVDLFGAIARTVPARVIPEPQERGKPYKVPATEWKLDPILWGWTCELPDGSGLTFGGVHQLADDGMAHTQFLVPGEGENKSTWVAIHEELRRNNPLQPRFHETRKLRDTCKNTLAKARHLYFEGLTAEEETRLLKQDINPAITKLLQELNRLMGELKKTTKAGEYETGQIEFALKHLAKAVEHIKAFDSLTTPEQMAEMRQGQIELEIAAEAFDAEPPPRSLSKIAYDPETKLYILFGGEHFDYCTNDTWVFDPAKQRWFQRHQDFAPEPRLDAHLDTLSGGRLVLYGGAIRNKGFVHAGSARWIYDIANNEWSVDGHDDPAFPSDARTGHWPPALPEHFMKGSRPDAAANEAKLKAIAPNTWTRLKTPIPLGSRDWGTWVYDFHRDMLYVYAGGHSSYGGCDVARYHMATDRWEISDPTEGCLGCWGSNEQYPSGFNYNLRPWAKKHIWNGHAYDPDLRKTIMGSVNEQKIDPYCYFYNPDLADWDGRLRLPPGMPNDAYGCQLRHTKHGMFSWNGAWLFDAAAMTWKKLDLKDKIPGAGVDSSGLVYDPKRDRILMMSLGGYNHPFNGQIHALDMNTLQIAPLNPEGMNHEGGRWDIFLREMAYHPDSDLFLWPQRIKLGGKVATDRYVAYDAGKNRWVTIKLAINEGDGKAPPGGVNTGIHWDAKRGLFWLGDASWNGSIWVLKFDPAKAEIMDLTAYAKNPDN